MTCYRVLFIFTFIVLIVYWKKIWLTSFIISGLPHIPSAFPFLTAQEPYSGPGCLIDEVSRSHLDTPHSVGLPWTWDRSVADFYLPSHNIHTRQTSRSPDGIRIYNASKRAAAEPDLRLCSY